MNQTHGPFFQHKATLPPLSALHKYERSTKDSDREHLMINGHRRAITNMDVRPSDRRGISMSKKSSQPIDPFYSEDMVALAEEANEQYKNMQ